MNYQKKKVFQLKKIDIKNRTCYYFDYKMDIIDINFRDILFHDKKLKPC